jgi:hypothetical protein
MEQSSKILGLELLDKDAFLRINQEENRVLKQDTNESEAESSSSK